MVKTPYVPAYDIQLQDSDGRWREASRYQIWTKRVPLDEPALSLLERRDGGVLRVPDQERVMHRIPAGTPYHVEHSFGFWRTTGSDTLFLRAEVEGDAYYTMIVGTHSPQFGTEMLSWFCPRCGQPLQTATFELRRFGLEAFWAFALECARAFNAAPATRACRGCGHVHPGAYGLDPQLDATDEAAGRAQW